MEGAMTVGLTVLTRHSFIEARIRHCGIFVVVNFLSQLIFIFLLFWGMVMYAYEFETKEKQKLTKIKN